MRTKTLFVAGLVLALVFSLAGPATSSAAPPERVDVLIGFTQQPGPAEEGVVRGAGGVIRQTFHLVPAVAANVPETAIPGLLQDPRVRYVEPDGPVYAIDQTVPWGIDRVFGDESYSFDTWDITRGYGIAVAILDTGIDESHEDLPQLSDGINTIDNTHWGADGHGHGTHVAGTVAALDNQVGVVGVGPELGLYAVKVLDDGGSGTVSSVVAGIEWAVEEDIPVLNMSLSTDTHYQTLQDACNAAYVAGHLLVAAAGNSGNPPGRGDNVGYPAAYGSVIAVAASRENDTRASFSSTGSAVELIAPGFSVLSTLPGNSYGTYSGTSMASPHVAGAAALAWAVNPGLTNVEIRGILQITAEDLGLPSNHQGHGLVRADLAVRAIAEVEPPATGTIEGTVNDEDGAAIEGATVVVEETDLSATTDSKGHYFLENVPTGEQEVTASADGYQSETATVTVEEDATVTQDFTLEAIPTYTVSGTVTGTKGDGDALEGATVVIEGTDWEATTGSDGTYSISDVEEGTYDITASRSGYTSETKTVTVDSDTTVDFTLEEVTAADMVRVESIPYSTRGGRLNDRHLDITLLLLDDLDQPVADASVSATLYWDNDNKISWDFQGTTGADGTVTFTLINHGNGCYWTNVTAVVAEGLEWDGVTPENKHCK